MKMNGAGDWGCSGNVVGPFQAAQGRFYRGQIIPMVAGWVGEIEEDFEKVIKVLARAAASGDEGLTISPLVNTDRKGGAYPIMLQQFRRAIGVAIARVTYLQATLDTMASFSAAGPLCIYLAEFLLLLSEKKKKRKKKGREEKRRRERNHSFYNAHWQVYVVLFYYVRVYIFELNLITALSGVSAQIVQFLIYCSMI